MKIIDLSCKYSICEGFVGKEVARPPTLPRMGPLLALLVLVLLAAVRGHSGTGTLGSTSVGALERRYAVTYDSPSASSLGRGAQEGCRASSSSTGAGG